MQNVIFVDINEIKGVKKLSQNITAVVSLVTPSNNSDGISGSLVYNDETQQYESNCTWKFQYGNSQLCSLFITLNCSSDVIAKVKLPLKWFQRNSIVVMQFPMKPNGFDGNILITITVHLSENHAAAFDAPRGKLKVKPTWEITSTLVNNFDDINYNNNNNFVQHQENEQQEELPPNVEKIEDNEESTDDDNEEETTNFKIPMYYPEKNKTVKYDSNQFNPSTQEIVYQQEFNLQQVYQTPKPQYYQHYYQQPPQYYYQQPPRQYYQQYYQQPPQQYYQQPPQQYYQQYYQKPPQKYYQQQPRPMPTSGLVKNPKVIKNENMKQNNEHVYIPPPVNNTSSEIKTPIKPKEKGKLIDNYKDQDISLGVQSIDIPDSSAINNDQPEELKEENLKELDVSAHCSKKSKQETENEKLVNSEEPIPESFLPQYPEE